MYFIYNNLTKTKNIYYSKGGIMMPVHKCKAPGCMKMIDSAEDYCTQCQEKNPELKNNLRNIARTYVYDNPNCSVTQLSEDTGIPIIMINSFIKEGTIILVEAIQKKELCISCKKRDAEPGKKECSSCREKSKKAEEKVLTELTKKVSSQQNNYKNQNEGGFHSKK